MIAVPLSASVVVIGRHVLRNALLPFITIVGLQMAAFIGGVMGASVRGREVAGDARDCKT